MPSANTSTVKHAINQRGRGSEVVVSSRTNETLTAIKAKTSNASPTIATGSHSIIITLLLSVVNFPEIKVVEMKIRVGQINGKTCNGSF